jgi:quercetin dioxygenase-like cupin family protein
VKVLRSRGFRWHGVEPRVYKEAGHSHGGVTRHLLLGGAPDQAALSFETRYLEVEAGGHTSLEYHQHPHAVVVIRGRGTVVLDREHHEVQAFDCVYVAPNEVHQFRADLGEALGFLCVVDRERDRPVSARKP